MRRPFRRVPNWPHSYANAMLVNMLLKYRKMTESRSCGELAMKASCALVFLSNFCEPAEKRKVEAPAQGVKGIQPVANNRSPIKGMSKPLDDASVSLVLQRVGNHLQNSENHAFPLADG